MLNFTNTVSSLVLGTARQTDTKLVHPFEKFSQNLLVKFYSIKNFKFLTHELKQRKTLVWGLLKCKTLEVSNFAMYSSSNHQKMSLLSDKKMAGLRHMTCSSVKNPLGQVKFMDLFKFKFACDYDEARD